MYVFSYVSVQHLHNTLLKFPSLLKYDGITTKINLLELLQSFACYDGKNAKRLEINLFVQYCKLVR